MGKKFEEYRTKDDNTEAIIDYLSGFTDNFAISSYEDVKTII